MSEIRIKELASATGQLDKFDEFEFIVDVPAAEASMKIKGSELQERVAPKAHTHPIAEVQGLSLPTSEITIIPNSKLPVFGLFSITFFPSLNTSKSSI